MWKPTAKQLINVSRHFVQDRLLRIKRGWKGVGKNMMNSFQVSPWKSAIYTTIIYGGLALVFTALGIRFGPSEAQVGGTRPQDTIPAHLAELAAFGLLLGIGSMVIYGRRGLPMVFLITTLTVLLDIDHLPVYLGYPEPIRPAHSIVFIVIALAATAITIKALDVDLIVLSAFMGHLAVDTGLFAPYSPISFVYVQLNPYRLPLVAGAVLCALAAGAVSRKRQRDRVTVGTRDHA
jgi:hypothetical protein